MRSSSPITKRSRLSAGFTLVEVLIIAPIVVIVVSGFVAVMVATVGDILITRDRNTVTYDAQEALDTIEQDIRLSAEFPVTTGSLPSPQGKNDNFTGTSAFTSSDANTLVLNTLATDENPANSSRATLYYADQPNPCGDSQIYNRSFLAKVMYFVKDGSLWRRSYVPDWNISTPSDSNTICTSASYPPWQQNSCSPGYTAIRCKTQDAKLMNNVSSFTAEYFGTPGGTTPLSPGSASSATTVQVTINGQKTVVGRDITTSASRRASRINSVVPETATDTVPLQNGWVDYGGAYQTHGAKKTSSNIVFLQGLVKSGSIASETVIGVLPPGYRPAERMAFGISTYYNPTVVSGHGRVDVLANGEVRFISGSSSSSDWVSLSGIHFVASGAPYTWSALSFSNGWTNYGGAGFSTLKTTVDSIGRVHVKGQVKQGTITEGTVIAALPTAREPADYLTFTGSTPNSTYISFGARAGYGLRARGISSTWLSMQAMFYPTTVGSWTNLSLQNSWVAYANTYATPQYTKASDGVVTLRGRIKSGVATSGTELATLPVGSRPKATHIFNVTSYDDTYGRIDILSTGKVVLRTGSATWTSLDGISFVAEQ